MNPILNALSKVGNPLTWGNSLLRRTITHVPFIQDIFNRVLGPGPAYHNLRTERDFLRRIPPNKWDTLLRKVDLIDRKYLSNDTLCAFRLGIWKDPIFKHQEWPLMAFKAYLEGDLEEQCLPKLLLYDACKKEALPKYGVTTHRLINERGDVDPEGAEAFGHGLKGYFHQDSISDFIEQLAELPPETGQFFEIHQAKVPDNILCGLQQTLFHPFLRENNSGQEFIQSVIPPELMNGLLKFRFGALARIANPVLGFFSKEKMSLPNQRAVSLSLRDHVVLPEKLHIFTNTNLGCYHHDAVYHLLTDSANMHRAAWTELAQFFKSKGEEKIAISLFDGDFPPYRATIRANPFPHTKEELFWISLIKTEFDDFMNPSFEKSIVLFLNFLAANNERWSLEFGLGLGSLVQFLMSISPQERRIHYGAGLSLLERKVWALIS